MMEEMLDMNTPPARSGARILLDVLRMEGVDKIFGNPGSTEMPLMDALVDCTHVEYVLALQEATAVGMADGHAQATRRAAFVNLHTAGGIGNGMGAIVNARNTNTPLVITAGQQDTRHLICEPWLSGDLVAMARPVTKWAHEVRCAAEIGPALRRAFTIANARPCGPVFLSIPMNLLAEEVPYAPDAAAHSATAGPAPGELASMRELLPAPALRRVALLLSDAVVEGNAVQEAVMAAEALGADVYGTPLLGGNAFPSSHIAWRGVLAPDFEKIRETVSRYDVVVLVGGHALLAYPYRAVRPFPDHVKLVQVATTPELIGFDAPCDIAIVGDTKATLCAMASLWSASSGALRETVALQRSVKQAMTAATAARIDALAAARPLHPAVAVRALLAALPAEIPIVNEAPSTFDAFREQWQSDASDRYYFVRGGALGWGMPAAVGVSLAGKRCPVICLVGDGASMYSPQALWSAAKYEAPVTFVVFNNQRYDILMRVAKGQGSSNAMRDRFVGMTIDQPAVDFIALAQLFGLAYWRAETEAEIGDCMAQSRAARRPSIIEIVISGV